jgi:hypothetical protein
MSESESLFKTWFQPRLESQLSRTPLILPDRLNDRLKRWAELFAESKESLQTRSKQRRSVRSRARTFAKNAHAIAADLFVLCSLSFPISALPSIPDGSFYDHLRSWWTSQVPTKLPTANVKQIGQAEPSAREANKDSFSASSPLTQPRDFVSRSEASIPEAFNSFGEKPELELMNIASTGKSNTLHN